MSELVATWDLLEVLFCVFLKENYPFILMELIGRCWPLQSKPLCRERSKQVACFANAADTLCVINSVYKACKRILEEWVIGVLIWVLFWANVINTQWGFSFFFFPQKDLFMREEKSEIHEMSHLVFLIRERKVKKCLVVIDPTCILLKGWLILFNAENASFIAI